MTRMLYTIKIMRTYAEIEKRIDERFRERFNESDEQRVERHMRELQYSHQCMRHARII